jgi:hypothetical protein
MVSFLLQICSFFLKQLSRSFKPAFQERTELFSRTGDCRGAEIDKGIDKGLGAKHGPANLENLRKILTLFG